MKRHVENEVCKTFSPDFEVENGFVDAEAAAEGKLSHCVCTSECVYILGWVYKKKKKNSFKVKRKMFDFK